MRAKQDWISGRFVIFDDDDTELTTVDWRWYRKSGEFILDGESYTLGRSEDGEFHLTQDDAHICTAREHGYFNVSFSITFGDRRLALNHKLVEEGVELGYITTESSWTNNIEAELPDSLPLAVRVYMIWLIATLPERPSRYF